MPKGHASSGGYIGSSSSTTGMVRLKQAQEANSLNGAYELISTVVLSAPQAAISFENLGGLASSYKHLQIRFTAVPVADKLIQIRFNNVAGPIYSYHGLEGNGSAAASFASTSQSLGWLGYSPAGSTFPAVGIVDVLDAFSTTKAKTARSFFGSTQSGGNRIQLISTGWYSTSAITSISVFQNGSASFASGSRFSVYGLRG